MKKSALLLILMTLGHLSVTYGQVSIHDGSGTDPDASSMLDVQSTDRGFLVPRINIPNLNAAAPVATPVEGLLVYNTNMGTGTGHHYWDGSAWVKLMTGNTTPLTGTGVANKVAFWTSATDLSQDNLLHWNSTLDRLGIGTASPGVRLTVSSPDFDDHIVIQRTSAPDGHLSTSSGGWIQLWPGISGDYTSKGIRLLNTGSVQLMGYGTNGLVRATGGNGTLTSGGNLDLTSEVTGILPVANGGTGSSTQGWVDLTTAQTAAGDKTWTGVATFSNTTPMRLANGTAPLPAVAFTSDPNTGIYWGGTDILSFSTAGAERLSLLANGTVRHKAFMMSSGANYDYTWMMFDEHVNGNSLLLGSGGLTAIGSGESMGQVRTNVAASTETLYLASDGGVNVVTNLQGGWGSRVDAMIIASNGTLRLPTYSTNGIVRATGGIGTLTSGGAVDLTSEVTGILPVANGGTGSSTQGWVDLTTAQSAAGNKTWSGVATFSNVTAMRSSNGTAALPAFAFTGDPNTGIYWHGTDAIGFSTAGAEKMSISSNGDVELTNKIAIRSDDSWLRLNPTGAFTSGTYLPGFIRVDGGISSGSIGSPGAGAVTATAHINSQVGFRISNAASNGTYLRGNGTNFVQSVIQAADLPDLSGTYIRNQTGVQASSNFNISSNGTIGGSLSFGSTTRQMVNLYATSYGIGVQSSTQYYRSGKNFAWFKGGAHNSSEYNSGGGTVMMVLDGGQGNLGIGTTTPTSKLHVTDRVELSRMGTVGTYNSSEVQQIWSIGNGYNISTANNDFGATYGITYAHTNAGTTTAKKPIAGWGHQILFTSNGTRNASISLSNGNAYFAGNVGIGTTTPTYNLHVNGRIRSNAINETSDVRLKRNITPLSGALEKVLEMRGVTYRWRTRKFPEMRLDSTMQYGLIAQELEQIVPELVSTDKDGWKSIEYSHIVPLLIEAIKEQQMEIERLGQQEARLNALEQAFEELTVLLFEQENQSTDDSAPDISDGEDTERNQGQ